MNGLEEIQEYIRKFIYQKENVQKQIAEIEEKRTQLAHKRNEEKKLNSNYIQINELGKQISELGNESQELQNKLDSNFCGIKAKVSFCIDNLIAEGIRKIRKMNEDIQELQAIKVNQEERNARYQLQKQEFYVRFGRMPELSENAIRESQNQEKETEKNTLIIEELRKQVKDVEEEITLLARMNREFKNGNWNFVIEKEQLVEEIFVEPLNIAEMEPIEELVIEEFEPIQEVNIEEYEIPEELQIEEFEEGIYIEAIEDSELLEEKSSVDEIEELAKAIVEEIVAEQTRQSNINEIENTIEIEEISEDIIKFEQETEKKDKVTIPLFGQKATISNIIVKIEEGQLVYKAQMSDEKEIKIYPSRLGEQSVILRDKQNREECKEILINYAVSEYKVFDKKVVNKIDPLICELLIECAEKYGYDAQKLIYNYSMSFAEGDLELVPEIVYNLSYIEEANLSKKEKTIINKICKNARKNNKIDIIESFSGYRKFKYLLKRLFAVNNVKVLPEAKY